MTTASNWRVTPTASVRAGHNMNLGRRRAEAVRDFLVKYGARTDQIMIGSSGEQRPAADNTRRTGRWINRRVEITVTDGGGRVVSDQGVQAAIVSIGNGVNDREGCCERILEEMKKLDQILAALADLKGQYQELKDEHQSLKDDFDKLKQAQQALGTEVADAPEPVTEGRVRQMIGEETPKPSEKYARYNLVAGPASPGGNLAVGAEGQVFLPFAGRHAVQAQGDFRHGFGRNEGQFDLGIVNRFGPVQAGVFSSFKYVKFQEFSHGRVPGPGRRDPRLPLLPRPGGGVRDQGVPRRRHPEQPLPGPEPSRRNLPEHCGSTGRLDSHRRLGGFLVRGRFRNPVPAGSTAMPSAEAYAMCIPLPTASPSRSAAA